MKKNISKQDLQDSIVIVIEQDGSHYFLIPNDDSIEFSRKAYNNMINAVNVIDKPSFVLLGALYLERAMRWIANLLPSQN